MKRRAFVQRSLLGSSVFAATGLSSRMLAQPAGETDTPWSIRHPFVFNFLEAHEDENTYVRVARGQESNGDMDVVTLYRKYGRFHEQTHSDESCFVTTACLHQLGKSDHCHELNALRHLRDNYVAREVADGMDWIELYSHLGPAMVRHFRHHPQCQYKYDQIYRELIVKSVHLIDKNRLRDAFHHYRDTLIAIAKREGF